ncbi:hypothetical protein Q5H92_26415 [Hymenobacter sp. M29]|uniref:4Fe-4S ferredoxin-type domain-containing protein n=1 Tax=Hymenobacter mellowenesis TaxID=3063995 RepID=A0ABT9AL29_9BACT|nr:hypothetical protein [Hymenobacter sp. M29]MDO7849921.1 hypothetical protein [Hymenobacter sp. M29]
MDYDNNFEPESPDPCEICGGNFDGAECDQLCEGCEGCPVTGAPCHACTCEPVLSDEDLHPRCYHCGGWAEECAKNPAACIAEAERLFGAGRF